MNSPLQVALNVSSKLSGHLSKEGFTVYTATSSRYIYFLGFDRIFTDAVVLDAQSRRR